MLNRTYTLSIPYTFAATEPPANPPVPMWLQTCVVVDDEWQADDDVCARIRRDLESEEWRAE